MIRVVCVCVLLLALQACAPRATIAAPDAKAFSFTAVANALVVSAQTTMEYGSVAVEGQKLELASPYCDLPECAPNERGFVRLTFPEEPDATYGQRLTIQVISGKPRQGRALFTLTGEDSSRPALLTTP